MLIVLATILLTFAVAWIIERDALLAAIPGALLGAAFGVLAALAVSVGYDAHQGEACSSTAYPSAADAVRVSLVADEKPVLAVGAGPAWEIERCRYPERIGWRRWTLLPAAEIQPKIRVPIGAEAGVEASR